MQVLRGGGYNIQPVLYWAMLARLADAGAMLRGRPRHAMRRWSTGDTIVLRWVLPSGTIWGGFPLIVVGDSDELLVLYLRAGTVYRTLPPPPREGKAVWAAADGATSDFSRPHYQSHTWERNHVLRLMFPGQSYSIWFAWRERSWELGWYYVNLEAPYTRTPVGVDTQDHVLDIVVRPDRTWHFKDDDQLQSWVDAGRIVADAATAVRAEARRVASIIDDWSSPFCDGWESWRPDPSWRRRTLPTGWDEYPTSIPPWSDGA